MLENLGSTGSSSHPVLGELGLAAKALVVITGLKLKGACHVAGEPSICLIKNRAMRSSSLRVSDFSDPLRKKKRFIIQKLPLMPTLPPPTSVQLAQQMDWEGPRCGLEADELKGSRVQKKPDKSQEFKWS